MKPAPPVTNTRTTRQPNDRCRLGEGALEDDEVPPLPVVLRIHPSAESEARVEGDRVEVLRCCHRHDAGTAVGCGELRELVMESPAHALTAQARVDADEVHVGGC